MKHSVKVNIMREAGHVEMKQPRRTESSQVQSSWQLVPLTMSKFPARHWPMWLMLTVQWVLHSDKGSMVSKANCVGKSSNLGKVHWKVTYTNKKTFTHRIPQTTCLSSGTWPIIEHIVHNPHTPAIGLFSWNKQWCCQINNPTPLNKLGGNLSLK